ncbi:MAG: hypothetical protein JWQ39_1340 [Glaciihabitans sp.]|nr:hypothetical protein [Glaciihabitans sp.]
MNPLDRGLVKSPGPMTTPMALIDQAIDVVDHKRTRKEWPRPVNKAQHCARGNSTRARSAECEFGSHAPKQAPSALLPQKPIHRRKRLPRPLQVRQVARLCDQLEPGIRDRRRECATIVDIHHPV